MAKKINVSIKDMTSHIIASGVKDMEEKIKWGIIPLKPTRFFEIDERVQFGAHNESYIRQICADGLYYIIECINVKRNKDLPAANEVHVIEWHELLPYNKTTQTNFAKEDKYHITLLNSSIDSLLHKVYHSGVDFDVDYQRGHVWTYAQKTALIDSIFNNIDIGKFVFVQRNFNVRDKLYEIIDGKQRLTSLCEFYEDRFAYNGYFYSEMCNADKHKFVGFGVTFGHLENPTREAILETFIKLNTCGKPMAAKHITHVIELLKQETKGTTINE